MLLWSKLLEKCNHVNVLMSSTVEHENNQLTFVPDFGLAVCPGNAGDFLDFFFITSFVYCVVTAPGWPDAHIPILLLPRLPERRNEGRSVSNVWTSIPAWWHPCTLWWSIIKIYCLIGPTGKSQPWSIIPLPYTRQHFQFSFFFLPIHGKFKFILLLLTFIGESQP